MENVIDEEKIFSSSKLGINLTLLFLFIGFISLAFVVSLAIAILLILAEIFFGPWEVWFFSFDLTPAILWLSDHQSAVFWLAIFVAIYHFVCDKIDKKIFGQNK